MNFLISNFVDNYRERSATGFEGRDTLTPVGLARAMGGKLFEQLPDHPEKLKKMTFVDPACGTGIFGAVVADYLYNGLEPVISDPKERIRHIAREQIWMYDKSLAQVEVARELFPDFFEPKIVQKDTLNEGLPMKFDIAIGNPPYNPPSGTKRGGKLYIKFIDKFLDEADHMVFVVPFTFMLRQDKSSLRRKIKNSGLRSVTQNDNDIFPNVNQRTCILQVTETQNSQIDFQRYDVVSGKNKLEKFSVDAEKVTNVSEIPLAPNREFYNLFSKYWNPEEDILNIQRGDVDVDKWKVSYEYLTGMDNQLTRSKYIRGVEVRSPDWRGHERNQKVILCDSEEGAESLAEYLNSEFVNVMLGMVSRGSSLDNWMIEGLPSEMPNLSESEREVITTWYDYD